MFKVYTTDLSKQLNEYTVEYQVLQEEMLSVQSQEENLHKLESENKTLREQNKALITQLELALSNVQRLEKTRAMQQSAINKLEVQSRSLDVTIATLANFIHELIENKVNVEIPGEVRRIISQFNFSERMQEEKKHNFMNIFKKSDPKPQVHPNKFMVKSLSTGKIGVGGLNDQNMIRSNSLNPNELKHKNSFFSNSHNHILQQKLLNKNSFMNMSKIDIKIQDFIDEEDQSSEPECSSNGNEISFKEKQDCNKGSPTSSIDSGVCTPVSPKDEPHPLCNRDVNCTYGTRELKTIKSLKNMPRNSSPDMFANK